MGISDGKSSVERSIVGYIRWDREREDDITRHRGSGVKGAGVAFSKVNEEQKVRKSGVREASATNFICNLKGKRAWVG